MQRVCVIPGVTPTTSPLYPVSSFSSLRAAASAVSPSSISPGSSRKDTNMQINNDPEAKQRAKSCQKKEKSLDCGAWKAVWPAGNSRVWHPIGGRNCFTITTQSLCSVRLSRAMIPTPERQLGRLQFAKHRLWVQNNQKLQRSPSAAVLARLVVLFTVSQVLEEEGGEQSEAGGWKYCRIHMSHSWWTVPGVSGRVDIRRLLQLHPLPCCYDLAHNEQTHLIYYYKCSWGWIINGHSRTCAITDRRNIWVLTEFWLYFLSFCHISLLSSRNIEAPLDLQPSGLLILPQMV